MFGSKKKFQLSKNLKQGIQGPSSQGTFFKVSGVIFLVFSLLLIRNIYKGLNSSIQPANAKMTQAQPPAVLGAFDQQQPQPMTSAPIPSTYTVKSGDTLFNIAQSFNINWVVIATLNNLKAPYTLKPGTVIKLR